VIKYSLINFSKEKKMTVCKNCGESKAVVKHGFVREKQRYFCKECGCNFIEGDKRVVYSSAAKALAVLMYGMCKASYGMISRLFNTSRSRVYHWVRNFGEALPEPKIPESCSDVEFDEMWHFIQSKKTKFGFGKHWIVLRGVVSQELSVIVLLKRSSASTTK
jgi:transposase